VSTPTRPAAEAVGALAATGVAVAGSHSEHRGRTRGPRRRRGPGPEGSRGRRVRDEQQGRGEERKKREQREEVARVVAKSTIGGVHTPAIGRPTRSSEGSESRFGQEGGCATRCDTLMLRGVGESYAAPHEAIYA